MRIEIITKYLKIFTETSERQITVLAMLLIALLELANLYTTRYDTGLFELVVATIAGLAGYKAGKGKRKAKT